MADYQSAYTGQEIDAGIEKANNSVQKETGKGLSTNDFSNTYKDNVDNNTSARHTHDNKSVLDNISSTDITNWDNKAELTDIPDVSGFITKNVNDLVHYELKTNTGSTIELSINSTTYVMTLNLKNSSGTIISTGSIDLPLESMVVSGSYDSTNKKIVLTLQNGTTVDIPVADLVAGLQTEITSNNKLSSDLVDDTSATNKFVTTIDKTNWNAKYDKPSSGIPDTDLSSAVQTSLGLANTALQTHQDITGKQDKLIAGANINIASDGKTISATDTTYQDATTSVSGLMSSTDKSKLDGIATGATANEGTITGITMNGTSQGTSGVVDLGTVITQHQDISGKMDKANMVVLTQLEYDALLVKDANTFYFIIEE